MRSLTKPAAFLVAALLSGGTTHVAASELQDSFNNLLSGYSLTVNDAGLFSSQVRDTISLGSGRLRFAAPRAVRPFGISLTPPSIDIGCNGIDWHFGGLSWIDGAQIEQMLESAATAAAMYVIELAINALCEDCAATLDSIVHLLQRLAQGSMDSCQLGQEIAQAGFGLVQSNACKSGAASTGAEDNHSAARDFCEGESLLKLADMGFFKTAKQSLEKVVADYGNGGFVSKLFGGTAPPDAGQNAEQLANRDKLGRGNHTWMELIRSGLVMDSVDIAAAGAGGLTQSDTFFMLQYSWAVGELMMSALGGTVMTDSSTEHKDGHEVVFKPTIKNPETLLQIVLCGGSYFNGDPLSATDVALTGKAKEAVMLHCNSIFQAPGSGASLVSPLTVLTCTRDSALVNSVTSIDTAETLNKYRYCYEAPLPTSEDKSWVPKIPLTQWVDRSYVENTIKHGTLAMSVAIMQNIIRKVADSTAAPGCPSGSPAPGTNLCPREIAFLEAAPFPLYKVVNLAAIFPAMRPKVYEVYGVMMGYMMAREFYLNALQRAGQFSNGGQSSPNRDRIAKQVQMNFAELGKAMAAVMDDLTQSMLRAQALTANIRRMEQRLRDNIFARHLLGNQAFTFDVSGLKYQLGSGTPIP